MPLSFIVPDPSPVQSPLSAPPPVTGADDDDGMRPRLPTERWKRGRGEERRARGGAHAPALAPWSAGPARAPASSPSYAPAPDSGSGAPVIESSPAVPVPRGVRDTATILPMPAPGVKRQVRSAAGSTTHVFSFTSSLLLLFMPRQPTLIYSHISHTIPILLFSV